MIRWNWIQTCVVREREFFGSESGDEMKISHAVSRADSDEEMIQTDDIRAGAEDPGSEGNENSQNEEDTQTTITT